MHYVESMTSILSEEVIHNSKVTASNLVAPMTTVGQDSFSLYLLVTGRKQVFALALLLVRCCVRTLLTRANTIERMTWNNFFHPFNAAQAWEKGKFILGHELSKTTYAQGSSQHQGIGTHNHCVYPDFHRPWMCFLHNFVLFLGELSAQNSFAKLVRTSKGFKPSSRMLDDLCNLVGKGRPRKVLRYARKKKTKQGGIVEERIYIADNNKINKQFIGAFREGIFLHACCSATAALLRSC